MDIVGDARRLVKREPVLLRWIYVGVGVALTALSFAMPTESLRHTLYIAGALQLIPVVLIARWRNRVSWLPVAFTAVVGGLYTLQHFAAADGPTYESPLAVACALAAVGCLIGGLAARVRANSSGYGQGLWADAVIIALGAWIVSWAIFVWPSRDLAGQNVGIVFHGLYQPAAAVVLFLVAVIVLSRKQRPLALWLGSAETSFFCDGPSQSSAEVGGQEGCVFGPAMSGAPSSMKLTRTPASICESSALSSSFASFQSSVSHAPS